MLTALLSALALLLPASAPVERPVVIPASGGVALAGTLSVPAGPGPHPAAVLVGGFGPSARDGSFGRDGGPYADLARRLARQGVAVLRYDKRGIGDSEGDPLSWLDARPLARDAASAVRLLSALPGVDTSRLAVIGHSQGGDIALDVAGRAPVTRVVTLSAPGRPLGRLPRVAGGPARFLDRLAGPAVARATLRTDPLPLAVGARVPALMVHGTRDRTVPTTDMALLAGARRRAGLPTRTVTVAGANHFLQIQGRVPATTIRQIAAFVA